MKNKIIVQYIHGDRVIKQEVVSKRSADKICKHTGTILTKNNDQDNPLVITWGSQIKMFIEKRGRKHEDKTHKRNDV